MLDGAPHGRYLPKLDSRCCRLLRRGQQAARAFRRASTDNSQLIKAVARRWCTSALSRRRGRRDRPVRVVLPADPVHRDRAAAARPPTRTPPNPRSRREVFAQPVDGDHFGRQKFADDLGKPMLRARGAAARPRRRRRGRPPAAGRMRTSRRASSRSGRCEILLFGVHKQYVARACRPLVPDQSTVGAGDGLRHDHPFCLMCAG